MINWIKRLLEARFRISVQLYAGIGGAVALTVSPPVSSAGFRSAASVPPRAGSTKVVSPSWQLLSGWHSTAAALWRPHRASRPPGLPHSLSFVSASIGEAYAGLEKELSILGIGIGAQAQEAMARRGLEEGARFQRIRANVNTLIRNIEAIEDEMRRAFRADRAPGSSADGVGVLAYPPG